MANIEEKVENLIKEKINILGYELYDVLYIKEGPSQILRIVIDKDTGIDLNDCEKVNESIKDMLDDVEYLNNQYYLEVSSPGIERLLRKDWQLKKYIGEEVEVKQFKKDENGVKDYIGILKNVDEQSLKIEVDDKEFELNRKNISQVKTTYKDDFNELGKEW